MIIGVGETRDGSGKTAIILGLSRENIERLQQGLVIHRDMPTLWA